MNQHQHCQAIRYSGAVKRHGKETQIQGDLCASNESVKDGLCWLHRKVVAIRGVSVEKVLKGER